MRWGRILSTQCEGKLGKSLGERSQVSGAVTEFGHRSHRVKSPVPCFLLGNGEDARTTGRQPQRTSVARDSRRVMLFLIAAHSSRGLSYSHRTAAAAISGGTRLPASVFPMRLRRFPREDSRATEVPKLVRWRGPVLFPRKVEGSLTHILWNLFRATKRINNPVARLYDWLSGTATAPNVNPQLSS